MSNGNAQPLEVSHLPVIDQSLFPDLPDFGESEGVLWLLGTAMRNANKEAIAGSLITCCARSGKWQPIDVQTLWSALTSHPVFKVEPENTINAAWQLFAEGYLQIVKLEGQGQFFVPEPKLAEASLAKGVVLQLA